MPFVLIALDTPDEDRASEVTQHLKGFAEARPTSTTFEVCTDDWDAGLWDQELERLEQQ